MIRRDFLSAAALASFLLATACTGGPYGPQEPSSPSHSFAAAASPGSAPADPAFKPAPVKMQPEQVGAAVRSGTTGIDPRLVPTYVPAGMSANVMAIPGGLSIEYTADGGQRRLLLAVMIANPPPIGANGRQSRVNFRGQSILYSVFDVNDPGSPRHMMWNEPGAAPGIQPQQMGVPYFASATGFTEEEFFKVLNSLQKI